MDFVEDVPLDVIHVITQDIATHVKMDIIYLIINVFNAIQIVKPVQTRIVTVIVAMKDII
jgi:hypothetical protein